MIRFVLLAALACITVAEPSGYAYSRAAPNNGFESSVNKNNAARQLAVNNIANHVGSGTGTARKDGVPGTPLGVTGHDRYSYGHGHGHGGYGNTGYGHGHGFNSGNAHTGNYGYGGHGHARHGHGGHGHARHGHAGYGVIGHNAGYGHHAGNAGVGYHAGNAGYGHHDSNAGHHGFAHGHGRAY